MTRPSGKLRALACTLGVSLGACGQLREPQEAAVACDRCHDIAPGAQIRDLLGRTDPAVRGVGAHAVHLSGSRIAGPVECGACHVVPVRTDAPGHAEGVWPAKVAFSGLAATDGASPRVSIPGAGASPREAGTQAVTCSSTYCHGATMAGGTAKSPVWNPPDARFSACDACHGAPPSAPHPVATLSQCAGCHGTTMAPDGTVAHPEKHVNGIAEVSVAGTLACNACHGTGSGPAPPRDSLGRTDTRLVSVGAHASHLHPTLGRAVACGECHVVPTRVDAPGHRNGRGDVSFGALARSDGAAPRWDETGATCSSVYCHGATLPGGANTSPRWTAVDDSQDACGSCHGVPPPAPHPVATRSQCAGCHGATMASDGSIAHPEKHVDGVVEVSAVAACDSCHGAPPDGASSVLGRSFDHAWGDHGSFACAKCHPQTAGASGGIADPAFHMNGRVDVGPGVATCSASGCHD